MRNLKKALSLALASVMLLGMMVVGTSAASYSDVAATDNVEAIEVLKAVGVMSGDENGNFNPAKGVTRNEMAVIMANLLDLDIEDYKGATPFTDLAAWAEPYVAACYANGIVSGTSDTTYGGNGTVTAAQAGLMMMKALGWFAFPVDFGDDWKLETVKKASEIDLFDGIDAGADAALTRNEVAQLALNALESKVVTGTNNSANTNITMGDAVIEISGKSTYTENAAKTENQLEVYYGDAADGKLQLIEKLYGDDYTKTTSTDDYNRPADLWVDAVNGDVITVAAKTAKHTLVASKTITLEKLVKDNGLEKVVTLTNNQKGLTYYAGDVVELFMDKKNVTDIASYDYVAYEIDEAKACDKDVDEDAIEAGAKYYVEISEINNGAKIYDIQIDGFDAATYVKGAVVLFPAINGTVLSNNYTVEIDNQAVACYVDTAAVAATTVKVDTIKTGEYVTAGTAKYALANVVADLGNAALAAGSEFDLYADANDYVVAFEKVTDAAAVIDDVYYVDFVDTKTSGYTNQQNVAYYAQLVAMDGTVKTVELESADKERNNGTAYTHANWAGKLVTISDKKWTYNNTTYKADNEKFDLATWTNADWDKDAVASFAGYTFAKDSTRAGAYRVTADTKFVLISKTGSNLAVEVKVGGIDLTGTNAMAGYVLTEANKSVAKYVVIANTAADIDEDVKFSTDLIYIKSAGTETGDGFVMQTVYFADGSKQDVKMDDGEYTNNALAAGFYSYDINDDGFYTLQDCTDVLTPDPANNGVWKDEAGILENATAVSLYEGLLTINGLADIDVSAAKFVDAHSTTAQGQYDKAISSLANLIDLMDKNVVTGNTIQLNVSEDGAVVIILTSAT